MNTKNRTYYFLNDMINVKNFDPNMLKIDQKSHKNTDIYNMGYITVKFPVIIQSVNHLYFISDKTHGYMKDRCENKYLILCFYK